MKSCPGLLSASRAVAVLRLSSQSGQPSHPTPPDHVRAGCTDLGWNTHI